MISVYQIFVYDDVANVDDDECTLDMISVCHIFVYKILFYIRVINIYSNHIYMINLSIHKQIRTHFCLYNLVFIFDT